MIAECMGLGTGEFRAPNFKGAGGLPCSLEWLARRGEARFLTGKEAKYIDATVDQYNSTIAGVQGIQCVLGRLRFAKAP